MIHDATAKNALLFVCRKLDQFSCNVRVCCQLHRSIMDDFPIEIKLIDHFVTVVVMMSNHIRFQYCSDHPRALKRFFLVWTLNSIFKQSGDCWSLPHLVLFFFERMDRIKEPPNFLVQSASTIRRTQWSLISYPEWNDGELYLLHFMNAHREMVINSITRQMLWDSFLEKVNAPGTWGIPVIVRIVL